MPNMFVKTARNMALVFVLTVFALSSCSSPYAGEEASRGESTLTIRLVGNARTAVSPELGATFSHQITLIGPGAGASQASPWLLPGTESFSFGGLYSGFYTIIVEARHENLPANYNTAHFPSAPHESGFLRARGVNGVTVGNTSVNVTIDMYPATEVADWAQFSEALSKLEEEEIFVLTGDIAIGASGGIEIAAGKKLTIITRDARTITRSSGATGPMFDVSGKLYLGYEHEFPSREINLTINGTGSNTTGSIIQVNSDANVYMQAGTTLTGNTFVSSGYGGGVYIDGGWFFMQGGTIIENEAFLGGGVYVKGGGSFGMSGNAMVENNNATQNGGGVSVSADSGFYMYGGTITRNTAIFGGGVDVSGGTFEMEGGTITINSADNRGGGVLVGEGSDDNWVYVAGVFNMSGGIISQNNAADIGGGGVVVEYEGTFTLTGGTISANTTEVNDYGEGGYGGGVLVMEGDFVMNGGTISGNVSKNNGGGVSVIEGTFTMNNGSIRSNTASNDGGGVYVGGEWADGNVYNAGSFRMAGGAISGNNSPKANASGVWIDGAYGIHTAAFTTFSKTGGSIVATGHAVYYSNATQNRWRAAAGADVVLSVDEDGELDGDWEGP